MSAGYTREWSFHGRFRLRLHFTLPFIVILNSNLFGYFAAIFLLLKSDSSLDTVVMPSLLLTSAILGFTRLIICRPTIFSVFKWYRQYSLYVKIVYLSFNTIIGFVIHILLLILVQLHGVLMFRNFLFAITEE